MSNIVATVTNISNGKFFATNEDGSVKELQVDDNLFSGDYVSADSSNTAYSVIDFSTLEDKLLTLGYKDSMVFNSCLTTNEFDKSEVTLDEETINKNIKCFEEESTEQENIKPLSNSTIEETLPNELQENLESTPKQNSEEIEHSQTLELTDEDGEVFVIGDAGDKIEIDLSEWVDTKILTTDDDGTSYNVYHLIDGNSNTKVLNIDTDISIININIIKNKETDVI
ncbi:MAG: hypothetical protein GQ570_09915 [Helicobacteraceae bacterium]|nr:hypothetical protein [Helicobacteraceae bacterium]